MGALLSAVRVAARRLGHLGVLLGAAAASMVTTISLLLGGWPGWRVVAIAFCATMASYGIDRLIDLRRDEHSMRATTLRNTRALGVLLLAELGVAVGLAVTSARPVAALLVLALPLSVALYCVPWIDVACPPLARRGIRRIKDIPLAKAFYVSACWTLLVPLTALLVPAAPAGPMAIAALFIFTNWLVNVVACDFRDVAADRLAGVITFPVLLGRGRTLRLLQLVNVAGSAIVVAAAIVGVVPAIAVGITAAAVPVALYLRAMRAACADDGFVADVVADGIFVTQPLFAALAATLGA